MSLVSDHWCLSSWVASNWLLLNLSKMQFFWLGGLRELNFISFVTSRIDYCCSLFVGLSLGISTRLDRVLRLAARLVGPYLNPSLYACIMCALAACIPADSAPHCCFGFVLRSWLCSILFVWFLPPSFWCCNALGASLCYKGWAPGCTGSISYHAALCFCGCGPVHRMTSHLSCALCWWCDHHNSTSLSSLFSLVMAGLGVLLSSF